MTPSPLRRGLAPGVALVLMLFVLPVEASAAGSALGSLRSWGAATNRALARGAGDRAVQRRVAALRRLVAPAAKRLNAAGQAARDDELRASRVELDISLGPVARRLSGNRAFFLFFAYQAELERLARLAGLERAPTGRVMLVTATQPTVAQTEDELATDSDDDGISDDVEDDDDNDGVADGPDATSQGWGIPDAFRARPCVRITEEIPSFRTVSGAAKWLRLAVARRGCRRPRAERDVQAPRQLARLGITVSGARVDAETLSVHVALDKPALLSFAVRSGSRTIATGPQTAAEAGRRRLKITLDGVPPAGMLALRVTAVRGKKTAIGTVPVGVGETPQPIHHTVGKPDASPILPTPVVHGDTIRDELVPEGASPETPHAPADCPNQNTDADHDGVANCIEVKGFSFHVFLPPEQPGSVNAFTYKAHHVASNPNKANSDGDAEQHGGHTYALTDTREWANAAAGGVSDPSSKDSDGDGLTDVAEIYRWGTNPGATDTDADSRGPKRDEAPSAALFDGGELAATFASSPTLADTDGDGDSDFKEIVSQHSNPLVAQVPAFDVVRSADAGVQLSIPATQGTTKTTLTGTLQSTSSTDTTTDSKTEEVMTENKGIVDLFSALKGLKPGQKPPTKPRRRAAGRADFGDIVNRATTFFGDASPYLFGAERTKSSTFTTSRSDTTQLDKTYQDSTSGTYTVEAKGSITATFDVVNPSPRAIEVRNLSVAVFTPCLPAVSVSATASCTPGQLAPLGTLTPTNNAAVTLQPRARQNSINFSGAVDTPLLQNLLRNPGGLVFRPAGTLYDPSKKDTTYAGEIGESLDRRTAGLTIDFDDGRVRTYTVAAGVDRAWGKPNEPIGERFDHVLGSLGLADGCATDGSGTECFNFGDAGDRGRALVALGDPDLPSAAARYAEAIADNGKVTGAWVVFGKTRTDFGTIAKPAGANLQTTRLAATDRLTLAYAADLDGDQLFDREEKALGTSDNQADSDGDQATAPGVASDFFETRIGWQVKFPANALGRTVYSSPIDCDLDNDSLPDGNGPACPINSTLGSELQQKTDPNNRDTNGDGIADGLQDNPLVATAPPVANGTINGADMYASGGVKEGTSWHLTGGNQVVEPVGLGLCSAGEAGAGCAGATGYYRLTWVVSRDPGFVIDPAKDDEWARISVNATETVQQHNPATGRTDTISVTDNWLQARIQDSEVRAAGTDQPYQVYLHVLRPMKIAQVVFRQIVGPGAVVRQLAIASISKQAYLDAAYQADNSPNPAFAGMAVPGQDFGGWSDDCDGTAAAPRHAGRQGVELANEKPLNGPAGLHLPADGYRLGYSVRNVEGTAERSRILFGMTRGTAAPAKPEYCSVDRYDELSQYQDLPYEDRARTVLTGASVHWREMPVGFQFGVNVLEQQTTPSPHVGLPVVAAGYPDSGSPVLEHVDIDRTPRTVRSLSTMAWWGVGYDATPPAELGPNLVLGQKGTATAAPHKDGPAMVMPPGSNLSSGSIYMARPRLARWYVHADNDIRVAIHTDTALTSNPLGPAFTKLWPSPQCGRGAASGAGAGTPCDSNASTVRVYNDSDKTVRVKGFILMMRRT